MTISWNSRAWRGIGAAILLAASITLFYQQSTESSEPLLGLWGANRRLGPEVAGPLRLWQEGGVWWAEIAGYRVLVQAADGALDVELPGDRGAFRGRWQADKQRLSGHWIQPSGLVNAARYATPVDFEQIQPGVWQGDVQPLEDVLSLYLQFQQRDDGSIEVFLRNPERNIGIFFGTLSVERDGSLVRFLDQKGVVRLEGSYREETDQLSIFVPFYRATFDFSRRSREQAAGFYPRSADENQYVHRQPLETGDGWSTASITDAGLDAEPLRALVQSVLDTKTKSVYAPYIQGLLMARSGKLILEEYFYGFHGDLPHDTRSAGKSITSALVGLAMEEGAPFDVTTPVFSLFTEEPDNTDPRKADMTIEHLLTMTSGFDCDDNDSNTPGNEDRMQSQQEEPDWIRYTLNLPMVRVPGEQGVYCTAAMNLLGGVLARTRGAWLPQFFEERFARPLGIQQYHINLQPTGEAYWGGGIRLRPRDFLKLGQLYLDQGRWQDRQILSEDWTVRSTTPHASIYEPDDYGYAWWLKTYRFQDREVRSYYASGNGGQLLIVLPELDLVVLFMGGNYGNFGTWRKFRDDLVPQYVLPSLLGR